MRCGQDLKVDNTVIATEKTVKYHKHLEVDKIYIIDFGHSRRFELGPRAQPPVDLENLAINEQLGVTRLDPYSWDVMCLGVTLVSFAEVVTSPLSMEVLTDTTDLESVLEQEERRPVDMHALCTMAGG